MSSLEGSTATAEYDDRTDYFPVYLQACKGATPVVSGIYSLAFASLAPAIITTGISVKLTGRYRLQSWIGWIITIIAFGLMSTLIATDPLGKPIGYVVLLGWGAGYVVLAGLFDVLNLTPDRILSATPMFPIQAPLPVMQNAPALAFMWFLRSFASVSVSVVLLFIHMSLGRASCV